MSAFAADLAIWALLFAGFVFGVLGFFGLLIFPDIKSRMFTASRATLIAAGFVIIAVMVYSASNFLGTGQQVYTMLLVHTALLLVVLAIGTVIVTRILRGRVAEVIPPLEANT